MKKRLIGTFLTVGILLSALFSGYWLGCATANAQYQCNRLLFSTCTALGPNDCCPAGWTVLNTVTTDTGATINHYATFCRQ